MPRQRINPQKTVEYLRNKDPYGMSFLDDKGVYEYAKSTHPQIEWPIWPEDVTTAEKVKVDLAKQDTSPNIFEKLATFSIPDLLADDSKYFADTFNKSSAGMLYQALHGEQKYEIGDYDPGLMGEVGQFFLGHLAPLDAALFFGSGAIGGLTANYVGKKVLSNWGLKGLAKATEATAKNVYVRDAIVHGGISSGLGLGLYGSAGGTLAEVAKQSTEIRNPDNPRTEYDKQEIIMQAAKNGLHSSALGVVSGGLVKGTLGTKYGFAKMKGFDKSFKSQATRILANPGGQVFAEANAFTMGEIAFSDEELNFKNYVRGVARNTGIIGGMHLLRPNFWRGHEQDIQRIMGQTKRFIDGDKEANSLKNVKNTYDERSDAKKGHHDLFIGEELTKKASDTQIKNIEWNASIEKLAGLNKTLSDISSRFPREMEEAQKILNKAVDKGEDSLTPREKEILRDVDTWLTESSAYNDIMLGLYSDWWGNRNEYYKLLETEKGRLLTNPEKLAADEHLKSTMDSMINFHDFTNSIARGETPLIYPEGSKFKFWQERIDREITGTPPPPPPKPPTKQQLKQIDAKVLQVAGKMGVNPEEISKMPKFLDAEGNVFEAALDQYLGTQPKGEGISFVPNVEFKKILGPELGVDQKRKNTVDRLDAESEKKFFKGENEQQVDNFETSKGVIRSVLQRHIVKAPGGPAGEKGAGIWALTDKKSREHVNNMFNFAEFLAKKGRDLSNATMNDAKEFLTGKPSTVGNSFNYFHDKYFKHHNENLKDAIPSEILKYTEFKKSAMQGARSGDVNHITNEITIWPSKGTNKDPINIKVSEGLISVIKSIEGYVKKNIPSERLAWRDADGMQHEFLFWNDNKMPIVREDVNKIFNFFTVNSKNVKGKGNIHNLRSINPENFRKAFISWAETVYKGDAQLTQVIDQLRLAHKTGDMTLFYKIWGGDAKAKLTEASKNFVNEIFGDKIPEVRTGTLEATAHELRQLVQNVKDYASDLGSDHLRIGNDIIHKDQILGMFRYALETSARWTDIAPKSNILFKGSIDFPFEKVSISKLSKKIKDAQSLAIINAWETGRSNDSQRNLKQYISAKRKVGEKIDQNQAKKNRNKIVVEDKTKLNPIIEEIVKKELTSQQKSRLELRRTRLNEELKNHESLQTEQIKANKGKKPTAAMKGTIAKIADIKLAIDKITRKLGEKFQVLPEGSPALRSVINKLLARELKKNPGLKAWVNEKIKNKEYAGKFHDGLIELTLGKANEHTFFHENAHRFKEFVNKIGNKELSSMIERGEKMFTNEAKESGQSREEYFTDRMADYGAGMSKGIISKMKNWGKLMMSKLKKYVFGTDKLKKEDIARLLGSEVYKGFDTRGIRKMGKTPKFKFEDETSAIKQTRSDFNKAMDTLGLKNNSEAKNTMKKFIANDVENVDSFLKAMFGKGETYEGFMEDVAKFHDGMSTINMPKLSIISDKARFFSNYTKVENLRIRKGVDITKDMLAEDMKRLGVKSGNIWDATSDQLEKYLSLLKTIEFPDSPRLDYLNRDVMNTELGKQLAKNPMMVQMKGRALPIHEFLESIGLNSLADKMRSHSFIELEHIARGYVAFEEDAKKIVGWGIPGRLHRLKDRLWVLDKKRYEDALAEKTLTKGEKDFISQAVDENWKARTDTVEGRLASRYKEFTQYYKDTYKEAIRQIMSKAEFEKFVDGDYIKWIEEGFYVSRILTKEFKQKYNIGAKAIEDYVRDETHKLANEEAIKKYGVKEVSNQQVNEFYEVSEGVVRASIYDMMNFSTTKVSSRFLKKRHLKLPERIGKIKVYETSYDKTMKVYASAMSKFLANVEIFPEYVSMNGFDFPGVKEAIQKVQASHGKWGSFIIKNLERQIGKHEGNPFEYEVSAMQKVSNTLAKVGLSFPTSGLKNLLLGTSQTVLAFRMRDAMLGLGRTLNRHDRASVRMTGATEMSLRYLETGGLDRILDASLFRVGMMKPTEHFNRYLSVLTSRVEQERLVNIVRDKRMKDLNPKKYEKSMRRLKDFYKLNEEDITLLEKYGMDGIDGHKLEPYEMAVQNRKIKNVYQKMDSMAHINTQGASMDLFMPEWAGKTYIKPLTLYKRMAYAATRNTWNNSRIAWKNKEMMRLLMHGAGTYLTGQTLISIGSHLLGNPPPKENSSWWSQMLAIMWRGEFMGLLSEFLSPHAAGISIFSRPYQALGNIFKPAIIENGQLFVEKIGEASMGVATPGQATKDYAKRTIALYGGIVKTWENATNPYKTEAKRWSAIQRDFENEFKVQTEVEYAKTIRDPYYRNLKEAFLGGSEKDFAKQYILTIFAVANDMMNEGYTKQIRTLDEALKAAEKVVNRNITGFNPNPASFYKDSDLATLRALDFSKWIIDGMGEKTWIDMQKTEMKYYNKIDKFKASLLYNLRQLNLGDLAKKVIDPERIEPIKNRKKIYW